MRSEMSSRIIMSDVVSWLAIAFSDCPSFTHSFARLRGMEVRFYIRPSPYYECTCLHYCSDMLL